MERVSAAVVAFVALVAGVARADNAPSPRALTNADDARGCAPLGGGGYAVATGGGLVLVAKDGTHRVLTALDGLPDTRIHAVIETPVGLWVGTESGAALVRAGSVVRTFGDAPVHALLASAASGIVVGTWGAGVFRLASEGAPPILVPTAASGKHVAAIAEHAGSVFVAYSDGPVARLDGNRLRPLGTSPTHGQALTSAGTRLLLGDIEGAYRLDGTPSDAMRVQSFASVDVRGIAVADKVLVATYGSGLLAGASAEAAALRPERGVPRWVRGVGVLGSSRCAATTEGLFVDEGSGWKRVAIGGPPSSDVTTLAVLGDRVAVGTFDRGAAIYHDGSFERVHGLEHDETVNASAWQGDRLWLGTAHGLVRVEPSGVVVRRLRAADGLPSSTVRAILLLPGDRLLVGTDEGAAFVDGDRITPLVAPEKKGSRPPLSSPMHATWSLARSGDGTLFLGTASGLYYGKDGAFMRASVSSGELADDWVTALAVTTNAARTDVLAGSYSAGVTRLTFDGGVTRPAIKQLGGGYVNPDGLTIKGGDLLASTMDGVLSRPLADDAAAWRTRPFATVGRDVTATRVVGGTLWVASRRGIAINSH